MTRSLKRYMFAVAVGSAALCALSIDPATSLAQPADAIGKPLPDGAMTTGSISVRVVAGTPTAAVVGTDVTLTVNGEPRIQRTDASGRAMFNGLPANAKVQAKVADAEGKPVTSEEFGVPESGGVKLMLSTKPFAAGGPAMGAGGAPEARQMSGQARPERDEPAGQFSIRLTYNNTTMVDRKITDNNPPVGETVTLVGYASDDSVTVKTAKSDDKGRVTFGDLDPSGSVVYFAMALLPRAGAFDRLMTKMPIQLDGQMGARAILSADKRDATSPPIDELPMSTPTPAGKFRVSIEEATAPTEVKLVDATTKQVIAKGMPAPSTSGDSGEVQGRAAFEATPGTAPGALEVMVRGGPTGTQQPIGGVPIYVVPVAAQSLDGFEPAGTNNDGQVSIKGPTTGTHKAVFVVNGRALVSDPFSLETSGGKLDILAQWTPSGKPEIVFDLPAKPGQVVYAETTVKGALYRSLPVQPIPTAGAYVQIFVTPVAFRFGLRAVVEDTYLGVQGRFIVENASWKPYRAGPDGLLIPLPKGHKGGQVADMNQSDVSVAAGEGLRILRPIAPGRKMIVAAFSLPIEDGAVSWRLDLPMGLAQSGMEIKQTPGMKVNLPPGMPGQTVCVRDDKPVEPNACLDSDEKWFVLDGISIEPQRSMVFAVQGLPATPGWKVWAPRVIGVFVLLVLVGGVAFALLRKGAATPERAAKRAALLDELVELDRTGRDPTRREQVMAELEQLWT